MTLAYVVVARNIKNVVANTALTFLSLKPVLDRFLFLSMLFHIKLCVNPIINRPLISLGTTNLTI